MERETLKELASYQAWADATYWKALHENPKLLEDAEIRKRLNHMAHASEMLRTLARGEVPDMAAFKDPDTVEELEAALSKGNRDLLEALDSAQLDKMIQLPRGPKGPFEAPVGVLLMQAMMHSQHHRGQNGSRMRGLGVAPPMTDYVIWCALDRP